MAPPAAARTARRSAAVKAASSVTRLVGRRHHQHRIGAAFGRLQRGQRHRRRGVAADRLQQHGRRRRRRPRAAGPAPGSDAPRCPPPAARRRRCPSAASACSRSAACWNRLVAPDSTRNCFGIAGARQRPQPRAGAAGHDDRLHLDVVHASNPRGFIDCQRQLSAHMRVQVERARQPSSCSRQRGVGIAGGHVARPARHDLVRHRRGRWPARRRAPPRARCSRGPVPRLTVSEPACVEQAAQRGHMAFGQVADVDVVAHAGAVGRVVVVAEDLQLRAPAHGHLRHVGHQVVGRAARVFADQAALVRAHRVEVAQAGDLPARRRRRPGRAGSVSPISLVWP